MPDTTTSTAAVAGPDTIQRLQSSVPEALALMAAMELDLFSHLTTGIHESAALASALSVREDRLLRLLYALTAIGLVERRVQGFANSAEAATYLDRKSPSFVGDLHRFWREIWSADMHTAESIRSGKPACKLDFEAASENDLLRILRATHPNTLRAGRDLLKRYDFSGCRSIIDIGGGSGGLVATLCQAHPAIQGTLFDLPRTAALARQILQEADGGGRVIVEEGDILKSSPSGTHDVVIMRALIQTLAGADAARAISNAAALLPIGGHIYIIGAGILDNDRTSPRSAVFMNLTFLNLYDGGASYTEAEHVSWLEAAGCDLRERAPLHNGSIIRAQKISNERSSPSARTAAD
ncbi:methyltransferase [Rhizobium multihospitium]|uniref:Dimerisation domain-containing protein n=1 Tax=Rhizobium multihospitium TaxID=410764 RepID=A0A1C3XDU5_9HYPH|nr:methyltransferase [Rhizobium multihospitium]SCB50467.1 Dimerisation domain-containing protein [Rhizobium multihospitium]